jgi:hypothetical protein
VGVGVFSTSFCSGDCTDAVFIVFGGVGFFRGIVFERFASIALGSLGSGTFSSLDSLLGLWKK